MLPSLVSYRVWREAEPLKQLWLQSVRSENCKNAGRHRGRDAQTELISTICSFKRLLSTCAQVLPPVKLLVLYDLSEKPEKTSEDVFSAHPLVTHHPAFLPCTLGVT